MGAHGVQIVVRVLISVGYGGLIGLERELTDHPAGIRTHILVALGACIFTAMSLFAFPGFIGGDRVAAAVVTGIGFIGGGAILKSSGGIVKGLTTAASLWSVAAIGMLCGAGYFLVGFIVTAVDLLILELFDWVVDSVSPRLKTRKLVLNVKGEYRKEAEQEVMAVLRACNCSPSLIRYERVEADNSMIITMVARVSARHDIGTLTERLVALPGTAEVIWE